MQWSNMELVNFYKIAFAISGILWVDSHKGCLYGPAYMVLRILDVYGNLSSNGCELSVTNKYI